MAAAGDIVSPNIRVGEDPSPLLVQPPTFGMVLGVDGNGLPNDILWYNTTRAATVFAAAPDASAALDLIQAAASAFPPGVVRRITGTNVALDPSGGTSREFDALPVMIYSRRPLEDDQATPVDFLLAKTLDGKLWIEDAVARFVIVEGR